MTTTALIAVGLVPFWFGALFWRANRNGRFLAFLAAVSVIDLAAPSLGGPMWRVIVAVVTGIALVASLWPDRVGLGSLDSADRAAETALKEVDRAVDPPVRHLAKALDGPPPRLVAGSVLDTLRAPPFSTAGSPWRPAGLCYRVIIARLADADGGTDPHRVALWILQRTGRHYRALAADRRVVGRPHQASAWDEEVLLRCFGDEFDRLIPPNAPVDTLDRDRPDWRPLSRSLIDELEHLDLRHAAPSANRRLLAAALEARLAFASNDGSKAAFERMTETALAIGERWREVPEDATSAGT